MGKKEEKQSKGRAWNWIIHPSYIPFWFHVLVVFKCYGVARRGKASFYIDPYSIYIAFLFWLLGAIRTKMFNIYAAVSFHLRFDSIPTGGINIPTKQATGKLVIQRVWYYL